MTLFLETYLELSQAVFSISGMPLGNPGSSEVTFDRVTWAHTYTHP